MASTILARADALMRRRRQTPEGDDVPVLTDTVDEEDIPVLTEAEVRPLETEEQPLAASEAAAPGVEPPTSGEETAPTAEEITMPAPSLARSPGQQEQLVAELTRRIEQRLVAELPRLIEETVRDVLAEQEMIAHLQSRG